MISREKMLGLLFIATVLAVWASIWVAPYMRGLARKEIAMATTTTLEDNYRNENHDLRSRLAAITDYINEIAREETVCEANSDLSLGEINQVISRVISKLRMERRDLNRKVEQRP